MTTLCNRLDSVTVVCHPTRRHVLCLDVDIGLWRRQESCAGEGDLPGIQVARYDLVEALREGFSNHSWAGADVVGEIPLTKMGGLV